LVRVCEKSGLGVKFLAHSGLTRKILPFSNGAPEMLVNTTIRYSKKNRTSKNLAHLLQIIKVHLKVELNFLTLSSDML